MATGDLRGNIAELGRALKHLKYPAPLDDVGLMLGDPLAALPVLHYVLLRYSRHVTAFALAKGVQLHGKTDDRFVRGALALAREALGLKVVLTPQQFLEQGYAERKVLLLIDVARCARQLHAAGAKAERFKQAAAVRQSPGRLSCRRMRTSTATARRST